MDDRSGESADGDAKDDVSGVKIEFSDVWFRYPAREAPVLDELNMTVSQGPMSDC